MKKILLLGLAILTLCVFIAPLAVDAATVYYVSQSAGHDRYDGLAPAWNGTHGPWKSLANASARTWQPGDKLLLKAGDIWDETLTLRGDGTAKSPITITSYGKGERPYIKRTLGKNQDCITINSAGYVIRDLELGYAWTGIHIRYDDRDRKVYDTLRFENLFIHDIDDPLCPPAAQIDPMSMYNRAGKAIWWDINAQVDNVTVKNCIGLRTQCFSTDLRGSNSDPTRGGSANNLLFDGNTISHGSWNQVYQTWGKNQDIINSVFVYNYPWTYFPLGNTQVLTGFLKGGDGIRNEVVNNEFGWAGDYPGSPDGCAYDFECPTDDVTFQNNYVHNSSGESVLFMGNYPHNNILFDNNIFRGNVRFSPRWNVELNINKSNKGSGTFSNNTFFSRPGKRAFEEQPEWFIFRNNQQIANGKFAAMPMVTRIVNKNGARIFTLASATPGAKIYYTLDGSLPTQKSRVYAQPIAITRSGALNAKAFKSGIYPSYVNSLVVEMRKPEGGSPAILWNPASDKGPGNSISSKLDKLKGNFTVAFWAKPLTKRTPTVETEYGIGGSGIAWWKLNEAEGIAAADSVGGNPGTLTGCTWTDGKFGKALSFNGSTDYVTLNSGSLSSIADTFTISFWAAPEATRASTPEVNTGATGLSDQRYALAPSQFGGSSGEAGIGLSVGTNGVTVFELADNHLPSPLVADRPLTGWNLITLVYNKKTPSLYVNGKLVKVGLKSTKTVHPYFNRLGGAMGGYGWYKGRLDDVRVYPRALSATELEQLASGGENPKVAWSIGKTAGTSGLPFALAPISLDGKADGKLAGIGIAVGTNGVSVCAAKSGGLPSLLVTEHALSGWNHIGVQFRNGQPTLYINGVFEKSGCKSLELVLPRFTLSGPKGGLKGLRVYDRLLTDAEIQQLAAVMTAPVKPAAVQKAMKPTSSVAQTKYTGTPKVILDTDIGPDCDDVGAVSLLHELRRSHKAEILAITCCTSSQWGTRCLEAINRYFGGSPVAVGAYPKPGFLDDEIHQKYNRAVSERFLGDEPIAFRRALDVLRSSLVSSEDGSVVLISVGPLNNIADLLLSPADAISPKSGRALVAAKVARIVCMAGCFDLAYMGPVFAEWNVQQDIKAAQTVVNDSPVPVIFCGYEVGDRVITCANLARYPANHPLPMAYRLYIGENGRSSWDPITVMYALGAQGSAMSQSEWGTITIDDKGVSRWSKSSTGRHAYVVNKRTPEELAKLMDGLLLGQ